MKQNIVACRSDQLNSPRKCHSAAKRCHQVKHFGAEDNRIISD